MAHYTFGKQIGEGSFGSICEVTCTDDGWSGVAKRVKDPDDEEQVARFKREVRLQAQLDHPNILAVRAMNLTSERPWFAMERADANLRVHIATEGAGELLVPLFIEIAEGVHAAHVAGIVHRDLKPENVLIFRDIFDDVYPVVSDFGLGRHFDQTTLTMTSTDIGMGTLAYAAPEQVQNAHQVDQRADIYSLGKVLAEMLTGQIPFPSVVMGNVPVRFRWIVQKALEDQPDDRYDSVQDMINDLRTIVEGRTSLERPEETILGLYTKFTADGPSADPATAEQVLMIFLENLDDYPLLVRALPKLPSGMLPTIAGTRALQFRDVLRKYEEAIEEGVTYEYCDTIADFYERIYRATSDPALAVIILERLATLGWQYNRWHVGGVFARVLQLTSDPGLLIRLRDHLEANRDAAAWLSTYVTDVPPLLRPAFATS